MEILNIIFTYIYIYIYVYFVYFIAIYKHFSLIGSP